MVSLLIISHSAQVAAGVKELAAQMSQGQVAIAAAGGTHDGDLGTSVDVIAAALAGFDPASSVLVLVDMGSAIMSAEMALEVSAVSFRISPAPLVEGAIVAAVEASKPGATLAAVAAAAEQALETKASALAPAAQTAPEEPAPAPGAAPTPNGQAITLTVNHAAGLHMRPARLFVQTAARFAASVRAQNLDRPGSPDGNAKSLIDVMKLGVAQGHRVQVSADGDDADAALTALRELVDSNFGEATG